MRTAGPDIWPAANLLVKRHGEDTAIVAAQRSDALLAAGGLTPDPGETVN
jgi:hypothetical protein